jgi:hypothetical protein
MLIEEKSLADITALDIEALVGQKERNRLEFKETVGSGTPELMEFLRDVCAMVNADGGIIIIGAKTTGEVCTGFVNLADVDDMTQRLRQSVLDSVEDRIFDFGVKPFLLSSGDNIILIYIPSSFGKPHMVKKDKRTEFWRRYETDKRTMTIAEIRSSFLNNADSMTLRRIDQKVDKVHQILVKDETTREEARIIANDAQLYKVTNIGLLLQKLDARFSEQVGKRRAFRLTITPDPLVGEIVDLSRQDIRELLTRPPNQRYAGWNMQNSGDFKVTSLGFEMREFLQHELQLLRNGHFEFRTEIDETFSWKQDEQEFKTHPLLYPLPVTEYPVSFLRFAKELYTFLGYKGGFLWRMRYSNIKDCQLRPYHPQAIRFGITDARFSLENNVFVEDNLANSFDPDSSALKLIQELYYKFGFTREHIPFFDDKAKFSIPDR